MVVEGEGAADVAPAHELEARVVDQRDIAGAAQRGVERGAVEVGIDPGDGEEREDLIAKPTHGFKAPAGLQQRHGLEEDVVVGKQPGAGMLKTGEDLPGMRMPRIVLIEERMQRRCVDEDGYEP